MSRKKSSARGFTLIELLVVVAIIALLIAILLPSLSNARKLAKAAKCGTNLRGIAQANAVYAAEWNDAIAGSPSTSGCTYSSSNFLSNSSPYNPPAVFQAFDYYSPLGNLMNLNPGLLSTTPNSINRGLMFEYYRNSKVFICPANEFQATAFGSGSPSAKTGIMPSYVTAMMFMFNPAKTDGVAMYSSSIPVIMPDGYKPKIGLVGNPASKIYIADGAKFSTTSTAPDIDLSYNGTLGEACSDWGAHSSFSRSWDRGLAPGNGNPNGGTFEARFRGFRHGGGSVGGNAGSFKMEAAFFDGHVDSLDDLNGANPALWCPVGTQMPTSEPWKDVVAKFMGNQAYIVP
jgi:prepilin-type N-terminal cleavage/methylation domain-containing protein